MRGVCSAVGGAAPATRAASARPIPSPGPARVTPGSSQAPKATRLPLPPRADQHALRAACIQWPVLGLAIAGEQAHDRLVHLFAK